MNHFTLKQVAKPDLTAWFETVKPSLLHIKDRVKSLASQYRDYYGVRENLYEAVDKAAVHGVHGMHATFQALAKLIKPAQLDSPWKAEVETARSLSYRKATWFWLKHGLKYTFIPFYHSGFLAQNRAKLALADVSEEDLAKLAYRLPLFALKKTLKATLKLPIYYVRVWALTVLLWPIENFYLNRVLPSASPSNSPALNYLTHHFLGRHARGPLNGTRPIVLDPKDFDFFNVLLQREYNYSEISLIRSVFKDLKVNHSDQTINDYLYQLKSPIFLHPGQDPYRGQVEEGTRGLYTGMAIHLFNQDENTLITLFHEIGHHYLLMHLSHDWRSVLMNERFANLFAYEILKKVLSHPLVNEDEAQSKSLKAKIAKNLEAVEQRIRVSNVIAGLDENDFVLKIETPYPNTELKNVYPLDDMYSSLLKYQKKSNSYDPLEKFITGVPKSEKVLNDFVKKHPESSLSFFTALTLNQFQMSEVLLQKLEATNNSGDVSNSNVDYMALYLAMLQPVYITKSATEKARYDRFKKAVAAHILKNLMANRQSYPAFFEFLKSDQTNLLLPVFFKQVLESLSPVQKAQFKIMLWEGLRYQYPEEIWELSSITDESFNKNLNQYDQIFAARLSQQQMALWFKLKQQPSLKTPQARQLVQQLQLPVAPTLVLFQLGKLLAGEDREFRAELMHLMTCIEYPAALHLPKGIHPYAGMTWVDQKMVMEQFNYEVSSQGLSAQQFQNLKYLLNVQKNSFPGMGLIMFQQAPLINYVLERYFEGLLKNSELIPTLSDAMIERYVLDKASSLSRFQRQDFYKKLKELNPRVAEKYRESILGLWSNP